MSILKHLCISILITIFIAWRFPELNLQMVYPNTFPALIFGCIVWTQVLLWTYVFSTSFKDWYQNFIHEKQEQPYEFLSNQFMSHLFLFCTTGISWLFLPKYTNAIQPLLVYYFCTLIITLVLIYICVWIEDEILRRS